MSINGGAGWIQIQRTTINVPPWRPANLRILQWISSIEFDPFDPNAVWISDWYGIWRTANINTSPVVLEALENGHEQTVVFSLTAPPSGALLLSGLADIDGFRHVGIDKFPPSQLSGGATAILETYSLAYCRADPSRMVRVGGNRFTNIHAGATSVDGGINWTPFGSYPAGAMLTRVAVSATDPTNFVALVSGRVPIFTTNNGATWTDSAGAPTSFTGPWNWIQPLCSDAVDGNSFYFYRNGSIFKSSNKGANWSVINNILPSESNWVNLKSIPGELWISVNNAGLCRSTNNGVTFTYLSGVRNARLFDFGAPQPGTTTPTLYLYGEIAGQGVGMFFSLDLGGTWTKLGIKPVGNEPTVLEASKAFYGLFFVGTNGRGIFYGNV
jgi:hypothetical protein